MGSDRIAHVIESDYGMSVLDRDPTLLKRTLDTLAKIPKGLVSACGIKTLGFEDLGESKEYYPNHGYYVDNKLVLNSQLPGDDKVYQDPAGTSMDKFEQTLYHELGHGWDDAEGLLSEQDPWLQLSGWSKDWKPGLRRVVIDEEGQAPLKGEWCYDPNAGFTRFYAKRNPWDDFADSFAYYVAGCKSFLPEAKIRYFDERLAKYYK